MFFDEFCDRFKNDAVSMLQRKDCGGADAAKINGFYLIIVNADETIPCNTRARVDAEYNDCHRWQCI